MSRITRFFALTAVLVPLASGLAVMTATPAYATPTGRIAIDPCLNFRSAPNGSSQLLGCIPNNTTIEIPCQTTGNAVSGPWGTTSVWDGTTFQGRRGYVSDAYVYTGTNGRVSGDCPANWASGTTSTPPPTTTTNGRATGLKDSYNRGAKLYCTWGALNEWYKRAGYYPRLSGDAYLWAGAARNNGWTVVADAQPQSLVVFQRGVYGYSRQGGHVGYVTGTQRRSNGLYVTYIEMNYDGTYERPTGHVRTITRKDIAGMSYILRP